ncbi:MAG: hypothetical protein JWP45_2017 [Mucilaginibacter sp.]|nr:hypothetical protein [Mucilaginibacter sp.]
MLIFLKVMIRTLIKNLFTTFIISLIISIAAICLLYAVSKKGDYAHAVPIIIMGALYLNVMLLLLSSPVLFVSFPKIMSNGIARFLLYFSGPLVFILTSLSLPSTSDRKIYLLTGIIYIIIHAVFYYKIIKTTAK